MIKNIIFDFGDIFINLDKPAPVNAFLELGLSADIAEISRINNSYEMGKISTQAFLHTYAKWLPAAYEHEIVTAWNAILKDFPKERLQFLQELAASKKYRLFLLSNTNALHIEWVEQHVSFFGDFKACFEQFYLSQEIGFRKPNLDIFEFVLAENKLIPQETLFIDDLAENTKAAASLGIHTWNLQPGVEDVSQLFTKNPTLF